MKNLVSIITPVYNSENFIEKCITSTLNQSYENFEHIFVDDCSSDNSANLVQSYIKKDKRIKLVRLKKNSGAGVARNTAIEEAKGKYIAFLDCDDYWHENKLRKQVDIMETNNFLFTYTQYYVIDNDNNKPLYIVKSPKKVNYSSMLNNDYIGCLTAIYNADKLGKFYMPKIRKRQDWVLWLKILKHVDYAYGIQEPLAYYRVGNSSLSNNKFKLLKHNFNVYHKELEMSFIKSIFMMLNFLAHYFIYKIRSKKQLND